MASVVMIDDKLSNTKRHILSVVNISSWAIKISNQKQEIYWLVSVPVDDNLTYGVFFAILIPNSFN